MENVASFLGPVLWNILLLIVCICSGVALRYFLLPFLQKRVGSHKPFSLRRTILLQLSSSISLLLPLILLDIFLPYMKLSSMVTSWSGRLIEVAFTICFALVLIKVLKIAEHYLFYKYDLSKEDNLRERKIQTRIQFVNKVLTIGVILVTIAIILLNFNSMRKIGTGLLTGVGIGSVILGFAAQKSLGNLLAGFQVAFTQPIRIDDVVITEGEWGRVEEITLTYVVIRIWDQRRLILPINYFIEKPFQNWTRTSASIIGTAYLYVDFTVSVQDIREHFHRILSGNKYWDGQVAVLHVTDVKEYTLQLRTIMSSRNSADSFELCCYVREQLLLFLKEKYPHFFSRKRVQVDS